MLAEDFQNFILRHPATPCAVVTVNFPDPVVYLMHVPPAKESLVHSLPHHQPPPKSSPHCGDGQRGTHTEMCSRGNIIQIQSKKTRMDSSTGKGGLLMAFQGTWGSMGASGAEVLPS